MDEGEKRNEDSKDSFHKIKKYLLKDNFVLVFNLLAVVSLIFWLSSLIGFSLKINFLIQITNLFSSGIWLFLGLMLILSGILAYYKKYNWMFVPLIVWLLFTTAAVRTSNIDSLVNAATGEPVLGPDLDPYLFLRNAIEISEGRNMGEFDVMRGAPGSGPSYIKGNLMPWAIFYVYKIVNMFTSDFSVTEAGIISPVIFFLISIIGFFLFVYNLFLFKFSKKKALVGATISSFFYAFVPSMLHRTVAGIPELESLGMVWFWFALLFFALAWKEKIVKDKNNFLMKNKKMVLYGLLAGLFTGLMSWTWGGYRYIYLVIVLTSFLVFLIEKEKTQNYIIYLSWFIPAIILELLRRGFETFLSITDSVLAIGIFILIVANIILFNTRIKGKLKKIKLPESLTTIVIVLLAGILILLIISPSALFEFISNIVGRFFTPFGGGRVGITVAENKTSYLTEAISNFGSMIWLFFFGLIVLFYEAVKHFSKKNRFLLNSFFIIFISSFMFSSISSDHILNGQNFISKFFYVGGLILFGVFLIWRYTKAYKNKDEKTLEDFKKINISYFILILFGFLGLMFMRSAIRFFFLVAPALIISSTYILIKIWDYVKKSKDSLIKTISVILGVIIIIVLVTNFVNYSQITISSAKNTVPSSYNQQWHYAMDWVSENTSEDSIFAHWWDYGYWVQTLGKRATVADGGHPVPGRNHLLGRYMLTNSNPKSSLSFMNSLEVDYLLIDSTDIGKYSAFSSIGSDVTGKDRFSWIPVMPSDPSQLQETSKGTTIVFAGGQAIDDDIIYTESNGNQIFLPSEKAGLAGVLLEYVESDGEISFSQPNGVFIYNNQRYDIPLRYIYYEGESFDFGSGVNSMIKIVPGIEQSSKGLSVNQLGAMIYLSEKTKDTLFSQLYLLNDVNNFYPTINIAHVEDDFVVSSLKQQGLNLGEFVYYQGLRGPIKIWEINYPEGTPKYEEYLRGYNQDANNGWGELDYLGD